MLKRIFLTLALLACATAAGARGLIVVESSNTGSVQWSSGFDASYNKPYLRGLCRVLDAYGSDYKIAPANAVLTEFARTGLVYSQRVGSFGYNTASSSEQFSWVIHVGFNGNVSSRVSGYRPDSLTRTVKLPTVPQLFLVDDVWGGQSATFLSNAADSNGVAEYIASGQGSGNHEGEGSVWIPGRTERFFDTVYGGSMRISSTAPSLNGGIRKLMCVGANATMTQMEYDAGVMVTNPDSGGWGASDTVKVFEKLNSHKNGAARIVFASCFASAYQDSALAAAGTEYANDKAGVNFPVLLFALAHLDSLTGGDVLSNKRVQRWAAVVHGVGTSTDRRYPGGLFAADSTLRKSTADSLATTGVKLTLAADPESLAINPSIAVQWKRAGQVRFAPAVRVGLDLLAAFGAGGANATYARPVDVWGRYRNRAVYGGADSLRTIANADTSMFQQMLRARSNLASVVGSSYLSAALIPPDGDWSPYQLRRNQNSALVDSVAWLAAKLGSPCIIQNGFGRENDPAYLTNPKGYGFRQRAYTVNATSKRGERVNFLSYAYSGLRGSQVGSRNDGLSFFGYTTDSSGAICVPGPCPGPNAVVQFESAFWTGLFGPGRDYLMFSYDGATEPYSTVYGESYLNDFPKASILYLPEQAFGGQSTTRPNRWGFWVVKHLMAATNVINYAAGRTVIVNSWPEDVQP